MSRLGVWVAGKLNRFFPVFENIANLSMGKQGVTAYQDFEYREVAKIFTEFGRRWDLQGKTVLDIGSGLGGKPLFYTEYDPKNVVGLDLRFWSCKTAKVFVDQHHANAKFLCADAAKIPLPSNYFDVIVSVNVFEHIENLPDTLAETYRVLKPGGFVFLHFCPFYSPWGAHVESWINFPWPHLFFSDKTLLELSRQIDEQNKLNEHYILTAQVEWDKLEKLPELNRVTIKQFSRYLEQTRFKTIEFNLLPLGRHYFRTHGWGMGWLVLAVLKNLTKLPILREIITTKMAIVLTKIT